MAKNVPDKPLTLISTRKEWPTSTSTSIRKPEAATAF
jgi:hypothetical protein